MFQGSMVALVTPMHASGEVDYSAMGRLVDWHLQEGTDAFVILGSTGESIALSDTERAAVLDFCLKRVDGKKPVIVGTGHSATAKALEYTQAALHAGADAALLAMPAYNRPPQEGLYRHCAMVADTVPLPIILYNVPSRTACDLLPETLARLVDRSNIVGLKDATGSLERMKQNQALCGEAITYFSGDDPSALAFMREGGKGVISITSNIAPKWMHEMCDLALQGDFVAAQKIDERLASLHTLMCIESNPIPVKWSLAELNRIEPHVRLPLVPLSEPREPILREALKVLREFNK